MTINYCMKNKKDNICMKSNYIKEQIVEKEKIACKSKSG